MFWLGGNYKYDVPNNAELSEWGERVFQLSYLILGFDSETAQAITLTVLNQWKVELYKQNKKAGRTRLYQSRPDTILKNRYHLLQTITFDNLQRKEINQEKNLKLTKRNSDVTIHPWIMILRYVKYILKRTINHSDFRSIGICRILRHYQLVETSEIFDLIFPAEFQRDPQQFSNDQGRLFGNDKRNNELRENRFQERFEFFAEIDEPGNITSTFKNYIEKNHPAVDWVENHLKGLLSPWGAKPKSKQSQSNEVIHSAANYLKTLSKTRVIDATDYCAADELRMLVLTNPEYFKEFIEEELRVEKEQIWTKKQFRELQLPLMKNNIDNDFPQSPPGEIISWTTENENEALKSFNHAIMVRKNGWTAETLFVKVNDELLPDKIISGDNVFNISITPTELIDFYLRENGKEVLLYQFKIDFDKLAESKKFEDTFTAEGGQTISLRLNPEVQDDVLTKFNLHIEYIEPWFWKYRRAWLKQSSTRSLFGFPLGIKLGLGFATILFLFIFLGWYLVFWQQNNLSPIVISEHSPVVLPNETPIGNVEKEQRNTVKDELAVSNKKTNNNSSIQNSANKKIEKQNAIAETQPKQQKQNSPINKKTIPQTRPQMAENFVNSDEKLATSIFGNPSEIIREPGIVGQSGTSRSESSNTKGYIVSPNETYVRPSNIKLNWSEIPGAVRYLVDLRNSGGRVIFRQYTTSANSSVILDNLSPGDNYFWRVVPVNSNNTQLAELPEGNFSTLPNAALKRISVAEEQYVNSPLLLGIVYMKNGLTDEAIAKFNEYAVKNPKSKLVQQLLSRAKTISAK